MEVFSWGVGQVTMAVLDWSGEKYSLREAQLMAGVPETTASCDSPEHLPAHPR